MKSIILSIVLLTSTISFADETVTKIDDYTVNIVISNMVDKEGIKTTISQEKHFTLEELNESKIKSESALNSWQNRLDEVNKNIVIQTEQISMWDRLISDAVKQGVIEPIVVSEEVKE